MHWLYWGQSEGVFLLLVQDIEGGAKSLADTQSVILVFGVAGLTIPNWLSAILVIFFILFFESLFKLRVKLNHFVLEMLGADGGD